MTGAQLILVSALRAAGFIEACFGERRSRLASHLPLALMVVVLAGCKEDAPPPTAKPAPAIQTATPARDRELDAGEAGVSSGSTSESRREEEVTSIADAAPDATTPKPQTPHAEVASVRDAGKPHGQYDAGDAGDGGSPDAGDSGTGEHEGPHCSSLGSDAPGELGLCEDKHEDWCESEVVVAACEGVAISRDEGVFAAYLDCLDEAFEDSDLCEGEEVARLAVAAECAKTADASACPTHTVQCEVYEGCEAYTVGQCDAETARFNEQYLTYGAPYFECPTPALVTLGE